MDWRTADAGDGGCGLKVGLASTRLAGLQLM